MLIIAGVILVVVYIIILELRLHDIKENRVLNVNCDEHGNVRTITATSGVELHGSMTTTEETITSKINKHLMDLKVGKFVYNDTQKKYYRVFAMSPCDYNPLLGLIDVYGDIKYVKNGDVLSYTNVKDVYMENILDSAWTGKKHSKNAE
ncbi:hypothetical protein AB0X79_07900 [Pediococcus pentosaceus]|uniref:hypothetical protein n=1 Tax=Pediococcus pentosaceus TaxID=1255 RepID=UPI003F27CF42